MLRAGVGSPSKMVASGFMQIPPDGVDPFALEGLADHPHDIANQRIAYGRREPGPQVWFWRSVGHSPNGFFAEGFIDELAGAAKKDPFEFRRAMLGNPPQGRAGVGCHEGRLRPPAASGCGPRRGSSHQFWKLCC
jgi:isoquinoline 1-oxidoreductase beta subunit